MAEIKYTYEDEIHKISTYDEIINTYNWIVDALRSIFENRNELSINCCIEFSADEISYRCDSIDEFKKYAFGKNIKTDHLYVSISQNWISSLIRIFASYKKDVNHQDFTLTSNDEMLIINLREALQTCKKAEPKPKETIIMKIEDNSVHIGNNNQISEATIGTQNTVKVESEKSPSKNKKESLLSKTFWQFLIPIAVGIIVIAIAVVIGLQ